MHPSSDLPTSITALLSSSPQAGEGAEGPPLGKPQLTVSKEIPQQDPSISSCLSHIPLASASPPTRARSFREWRGASGVQSGQYPPSRGKRSCYQRRARERREPSPRGRWRSLSSLPALSPRGIPHLQRRPPPGPWSVFNCWLLARRCPSLHCCCAGCFLWCKRSHGGYFRLLP